MTTPAGPGPRSVRLVAARAAPGPPRRPAPVQLRRENTPGCPLCGALTLLSAHVPNRLTGSSGFVADGTLQVALCARCHAGDDAARPLIEFFRDHPEITDDTAEEFAELLQAWVATLEARSINLDQWQREYDDWARGDL